MVLVVPRYVRWIALRWVLGSARRAGGFGWSACGWRRGKREGGRGIVARTMTSRSCHDRLSLIPCALDEWTEALDAGPPLPKEAMGPTSKCGHTHAGGFAGHEDANRHGTE